jgi:hypothetical protein
MRGELRLAAAAGQAQHLLDKDPTLEGLFPKLTWAIYSLRSIR